ncbi:MAG: metal ABC transporter ATP-binding protein [Bacillota bacterium]|uniref:Metal ABC transporter ATP-binding protein n=1 Tax=Virgibacillus salarius TaxID=447199 RepID=A0A941I7W1_9BACI|nr:MULTISPECIES: metal ABC transporter ATP-binding protein [Bacillaceae]NAZ07664.1 ATP-binding cassette domain-containing protein [Agaribacter marinus]MBR7794944.1 metal ABC transporter ATP-binding protein [Virgibacillus salarius]MCC2252675.1 metal ABC transporter ATP-binding protein [Virgibacillus sp. AGTR]MDY7045056.1 metal ABC transporter ATP-binding protein [Virgibacillus sp. M23]QRZ18769.1 metal ABC transporter ATP-binding protein [Virgibacillus sp. AGTR]
MYALSVKDISVTYDKQLALENVSFAVPEGSITGIIGPNGAGKSTLIKSILQLLPTLSGSVEIFNKPIRTQKKIIGYVPQRSEVDWDFPTNALDVVLMGRYNHIGLFKRANKKEVAWAKACLEKVGMQDYATRQISQLSGGQQQRVFLARAMAQDAKVYFMDEPFAGVDASTEKAIIQLMKEWKAEGKTVLVVHHDLQTVNDYFDHVLLLNKSPIAYGETQSVFTLDNLEQAYGGKIAFLQKAPSTVKEYT